MTEEIDNAAFVSSPLGFLKIISMDGSICVIEFIEEAPPEPIKDNGGILRDAVTQLTEYFEGSRKQFDLPLSPQGTEFQKQVWQELQAISFGEKRSYLDIAMKLGDRNATRAVGAANGKNPIAIVIPCHRVIGENGKLTGYAGGLWRKEWLLDFESPKQQQSLF